MDKLPIDDLASSAKKIGDFSENRQHIFYRAKAESIELERGREDLAFGVPAPPPTATTKLLLKG
jgi:hypothetical protein